MNKKKWYFVTSAIMIFVFVFLIGYDIFIVNETSGATISNVMRDVLWRFPLVIYGWLLLGGHFMSPFKIKKMQILAMSIISGLVLILSILTVTGVIPVTSILLGVVGLVGFGVGAICWSQRG